MTLDLLIRGGTVVDGSGKKRFSADVGISGARIVEIGRVTTPASRTIDADGRFVASVDDYQLARHLCRGPLARLLGGRISEAAIRFHDRLVGWAGDKFTSTEAVKRDRKSKQAVAGWLRELADAGALEQVEPGKGSRPAVWKVTSLDRAELLAGDCGLPETIG